MITRAAAPTSVVVGSYNVKNMFAQEDIQPGSRTRPKDEFSMEAVNRVLRKTDADVVSLQELSSEKTLRTFMKNHGLDEVYPHVAFVPGNSERGINIGIISKYPIENVVTHKDTEFPLADGSGNTKFSRDFLRADIDMDGKPGAEVTVYNTHSKSRLPAKPGEINEDLQRLSEAQAMRNIALEEMKPFPNRVYALTGDMNDNTDDASLQAILNPTEGEKFLDSLDHLPADERNTWPANPNATHGHSPEQFDHIIYPESQEVKFVDSNIHRYTKDDPYQWLSSAASDHLMITAEFKL